MITLFANSKGGVGKSTLAINVAAKRTLDGRRVMVIDGDLQATVSNAFTVRSEEKGKLPIVFAHYPEARAMASQVRLHSKNYDDIVIDCGGYDAKCLRVAMMLADSLVVPYQPRAFDIWALSHMAELIDEVHSLRNDLKVHAVLNKAKSGFMPKDNKDAVEILTNFPQLPYLNAPIVRREAFSIAAGRGLCVFELEKQDLKANAELQRLVSKLFQES